MESIIGLNGKEYKNVIAENYLCVPAVLETIIKSEGFSEIDKYIIANHFGVVLPPGLSYSQITNFSYSDVAKEQGIMLKYGSINELFEYYNLSLHEQYIKLNYIDKDFFSDYVYDALSSGKHIVCGFEYYTLYKKTGDYTGHVSIIVNVDTRNDVIYLLDPGPKVPGTKKVDSYNLYRAISEAKDGLWLISNTCYE